ncbi:MAG: DUF1194 domain-containing protein [Hyphomicrobiaceae bacterium]|nr:DUF1194 domain-containing protein [Hyphomicrobiaceae bacterium]
MTHTTVRPSRLLSPAVQSVHAHRAGHPCGRFFQLVLVCLPVALSCLCCVVMPARGLAQDGEIAPFSAGPVPKSTGGAAIDTALVLAVDVSQSVDQQRYELQMEGIARALEDEEVHAAIASAPTRSIVFALIGWADFPRLLIPWTIIDGPQEARRTAERIRSLPLETGEFTCLAKLMKSLSDHILADRPITTRRVILDVSGDGPDNCSPPDTLVAEHERLVAQGITINANPIIVPGENDVDVLAGAYRSPGYGLGSTPLGAGAERLPIDQWYDRHVRGGPGAFTLPAYGYADFARAIQRKFVMEISSLAPSGGKRP